MHVRDRVDLDRWLGVEFADGVRTARGVRVRRLAVLSQRELVQESDARVQSAVGDRSIRHTVVDNDVGLFRHRFCPVGLFGSGQRTISKRLELDEEQKTGKSDTNAWNFNVK